MAQFTPCFFPKFAHTFTGPKRPVAIRTRIAPAENLQLLSVWNDGRLDSILQATWALVLRCYTDAEDICFGYQRVEADGSQQISDAANMPAMQLNIDSDDSIKTVMRKANDSGSNGSLSKTCDGISRLFNTILMLRSDFNSTKKINLGGYQQAHATTLPGECRVRVHVKVLQDEIGIFLEWWNNDMSMEHMKGVASVFEQVLSTALSEQEVAVGQIGYFTEKDWQRICKWNAAAPESYERCIHDAIHEQMLLHPEKEAICAWDGSLTYSDLDRLASALACHLQIQGVGPEVKVALCFDKSKWNAVAMLAVLKAGGAFVPLDPAHPTARLQKLVTAVQARIVLCSWNHMEHLSPVAETLIPLNDDTLDRMLAGREGSRPLHCAESHNAAYVIFTSGSTGEPKGVLIEHRAYFTSAMSHAPPFRIDSNARVLQFAAHTFDASLVDVLTTLIHGGCVCVPSESARLNDTINVINDMRVNHATFTPSFIGFIDPSSVPGLKTVMLAGEAMSPSHLTTWSNRYLINAYGPTESSVSAAVNPGLTTESDCRDIGHAIGVRSWIVNPENHDQLVPVGCSGELILEGPTLARGYINNKSKTDEAFIYDPGWSRMGTSKTGRRFYKTGDLVRYSRDNGCLAYLGRKDTQIKIHGQRVELGEIENHLNAYAKVKHCLVLFPKSGFSKGKIVAVLSPSARDDTQHDSGLMPFQLLDQRTRTDFVAEARQRLSVQLPRHMVPTVWLCLEALPFLTSGKLDRKSVATWLGSLEDDPTLQVAKIHSNGVGTDTQPTTEVETQLASVWSRILNVPVSHISLNDSFLGLGGDSIAAITCTSHCKKLGIGLTVQDILHSKSVKELAGRVKAVNRSAVYKETVEEPFDLSPIQNLHFRVRREGQGHFNQSILTRINKNVDVKCLQQAIETLVMRHSMLRARFTDSEGAGVRQRITQDIAGSFHFLVHNAKGNEVVKQAISDSQARMNSISGPVLGIDLFTVKGKDPLLFMTAHHLVVDIVSWRIILEDLEDLLLNPRESAPQNGSLPFQTWCRLQADQCRTASTEKPLAIDQLPDPNFAYWGMENSPITYGDAACETFDIGTENTSSILRGCHQSLRTEPVDIFLAALLQSFNQTFKDRASPVIYNEGHGREVWDSTIDISRTVGWFTTLSPIFIPDLDFDSPHKNVMRVKDLRRRAANNGREDFARRVLTNQETKCGQPSPMEISFNYVGQHRDLQRQDGLFQLVEHMAGEAGQGGKVADFGEETPRFALFETSAMVVDGRLRFSFSFNKFMRHQEAIRGWISQCRNLLISMAEQLPSLPPQPTLSDFPMLSLTYENLDTMVSDKLSSAGIESLDSVEDIYPCSRLQQVLLLNHYRDSSLYIVHGTFEVRGVGGSVPDLNRLGLAWQQVVSHHAMLRTVFVESLTECDLFSQVVLRSFSSQPTYTQCSDEGDGLRALDAQPPMDHRQYKPMHRFSICQTASGKLFCRVELSHAVMDGASISVILRDLQLAYSGTLDTIRRPLFKNFIQCLQDSPHKAGLDYWCSYLSNVRPCNFPVLNDGKDSQRRLQCLRLNFGLFKELRKFSETSGITLSTAFNVAWGLTLRSYCGSDDVCFGYMVSLRDLPVEQIESIVGPVVNLMACRMNMAGGSALTDVLHQVQDDYMESLPYRHSSLVDIQHALKLSDTALFNTGVSYQKIPAKGKYDKRDIEFQEACPIHDPAEFPVFLNIEVTDDDAQVELNYWATTLSDNQAENLASTFLQSLENIIHHQGSEISRLESLSERDKQQIRMWNANIGEAVDECIHEVLDFKAKSRPDAPAVITHDEQLTYFELNESSSRLAAYISMLGVGPGVLVPIDFDKSKWMVVAIVAVLKTGAGCIPLHRHYSWAYLEKWMNGHGVQVALAASDRAELLECSIPYVVTVDSSLFEYLPTGEEQRPSISPSDTAYVLPAPDNSDNTDCVILDHSVILTRATSFSKILGINSETRLLQHFAYTSDMFLQEVFGPLVHGGCVCFAPDDFLGQIPALANQLQANFISTSPLVAASFTPSDIPGVNAVAFSGERISRRTRTTWGTKMHALYGTSETSSACITSSGNDDINEIRKIGSNVACASWVVDPSNHHCLVPIGCVGELLTEGPILACGYLENSQAENNFIEDPEWISAFQRQTDSSSCAESRVSATQKRQMFRTGDLVRYNSDGSMVYVGRKSPENERGSSLDTWQVEDSIETVLSPNQHCAVEWVQHYDAEEEMKCLAAFVFLDAEPVMDLSNHRSLIEPISPRSQELIATIHTHVQSCMSASQTPRLYFPVFKMPFDPMGRLNRQALQQEACRLPESDKISFDIREIPTTPLNSTRALGTNMAYWKKYLADVEPCLFPSLLQGGTDTEVRFETSSLKHAVKLHDFSRLTGIPSSVVLQVAWGLVLRCFTGSEDVCFAYSRSLSQGVMLDGNSSAEPRRPVVSRLNLRDNLLVEQVLQTGTLEFDRGMQNYVPLSEVQKELGADGVLSLLNTALDCRELSTDTGNVSRLSPDKTDVHPSSDYRIVVNAEICDDSVDISFSYKADSLSDSRVSDVMDSFEHIVNSIIRNTKPRSVVGDIDFFTERSCQQVRKWNATLPEKLEKCAHEMIKKQAQSLPTSAPAVCAWDANFTYQELESMSSRLAHGLVALGVAPETFVAMCFEKSAWAVVAQLAVLKAGGAFASLDPSHPETRLKGLADDIKARLVLCSPKYHEKASRICDVALTIDGNTISDLPVPSPITSTTLPAPENAAYAIFTSGTTGTPKATVVEHIALTTASLGLAETLNMDSRSRALQFSSYTFDVSVLESIITLMTGGCVCIPSEEERMNNLSGAIRRMGANFISVPPGITNTLEPKSVPSLTTIITGGEKITESHVERWADRCVINAYGPSEATCVATASVKVDRQGNRVNDDCNSIGVALCGRAWVVDPHNYHRLVPVGAVGELVLEGSNVARGYLNNERKTNEVFVKDPEWTRNQGLRDILMRKERMYRTGDLVRYNADGTLTFISRRDTQIKFNGQRIELEEIENQCLRYLPEGTQLAVDIVIPKSKAVSKGIAAFLTLDQREPLDDASQKESPSKWLMNMSNYSADIVKQLQTSVAETLPLNMIPKYFFPVRYLPFTSSGKLDRKGLRAVVESLPKEKIRPYNLSSSSSSKQVTAGGMEGTLRSLWENVLDLTPGSVGVEDSFFGLGGDSYSAMNLVGVARSHGISLSVTDIFKYPLFKDMAKSCGVSTQVQETTLAPFSLLPGSVRTEDILEEVADQCCVDKQSISDVYPCSPVQEGLLTLSTKQHGAYIAQPIFRLADGIDLGRFKAAWQKTVNQLEILRTRIAHTEAANFVQVVLHEAPISWGSAKGLDKLPNDILELPKHNGGMLTGYTIAGSDTSSACYFVWTIHHALYDGWTVPLILRQVEENYVGSAPGKSIVPYGLFIDHLSKRDMFESDRFWKSYLSELSSSPFPQNKNPLPNAVRAGNSHNNSLDISKTSMSMDLTLPVLIRAAWAIVVAAHSGSSDVCYGETLMGRNIDLPGITEIAGPALTTVPTRVQVHNGLTISQYLQSVHKSTTEMIPHQHSGLQRIRKLNNDTASACEFQNLLVIQSDEGQLNDRLWAAEKYQTSGEFFTHPLVVECKISKTKIWTTVHHDEIVVGSWLAQNLVDQFSFVLSQLLLAPKDDVRKLNELEVFSPQDTKQVAQWNSRQPVAVDKCIHDLILERCSLRPDAMAICGWDGQLTYQELCNTAASFARYLSSRGVGAEVLVPMCLDKSIWAVVTIVSILMAGGAFLPLDPAHPTSRHEEILADMNSDIILCSPHYCSRYSKAGKNVIPINKDTIKAYGALNQNTRVPNNTTSSNMAYTLFTSGSTGRPKGIAIEHKSVLSSIMAFGPIVHLDSTSRVFQFASLTFDAAILELFAPLLFGGCLCVPSEDERLNDVAGAIRRLNVSWTFLTPAIASIIEPSTVPSLKVIACGGDAVTPEVVTKWVNCVELHNVYGPTETVIFAVINDELSSNRDPTCIGWGIPCTLTWVVDAENHNRLAPLGAVGELALEGPALAREYLGNPQKTAEAFVDEPTWAGSFPSATSHRRIYKTGDLVRYNPDGSLECLGRKDHQVKLHGQRMELGEIEYRLKEDPRVLHGLVILPKSGLLQKRLVAVLSLNSLPSEGGIVLDDLCELTSENDLANVGYPEIAEIQKGLESQLPIYMVPQTWAVIKKLPMLVSGKLDRKKITNWLENVDESLYDRIMQDYDMVKQTKTEGTVQKNEKPAVDALRNIFAHVLNLPPNKINVNRSFVSLGGDSITGMAVLSRARKQGFSLTLHDVLQSGSIAELAEAAGSSVTLSHHEEKTGEYFRLSPIQDLYFRAPNASHGDAHFNQSITVRVTRRVDPDVVNQAIKAVVSQHSMFRARFSVSEAGEWQQSITDDIDSSYRFRVHSVNGEHETIGHIAQGQRCLDIRNGPVFAADLFDVRGSDQILFLVASHLCVDMVSWRVVLQDIQEFIASGSLPPGKPLSFKTWCELQMDHSQKEENRSQLPFNVQQPDLCYWGMERSPNVYGDIKIEGFTLDEQTTGLILGKCREAFRTEVIDILLSAVIHSFPRAFSDRRIPTLYNEGHGREPWDANIDLSRTVGWFTTLCPLDIQVDSDEILETVKRVKDTRRKIAANGRSYFAQNLLHSKAQSHSEDFAVPLEIVFNYLGRLQQLERGDSIFQHHGDIFSDKDFELAGDMGRKTPRFALFEISTIIVKGKLHVSFAYNKNMQRERQISQWMSECRNVLEEGTALLENASPELTLSDYPLLPITYNGLRSLARDTLPRAGVSSRDQVEDIYPCSPMQEGLLLSQLRDPNAYMFHIVFEVKDPESGRVDSKRLQQAWQMVVDRHSILRTVFIDSDCKGGSFDQLVLRKVSDSALEVECDDSEALERLESVKLREVNDRRLPKISHQLAICKTFTERVLIKLEINHAIIDGGSVDILLRDFALAYNHQLPKGQGPRYSDYIDYIRTSTQEQALAHWKDYMTGVTPCHLLFDNEPESGRQLKSIKMDFDRFPELQQFCEKHSVTLANLTLSAWAIVLRRFTGSDDVCFGYPSTGRDAPVAGIQEAVGIFINMLCCRVKFAPGNTLHDISRMVQDDYISSLPHQSCSLASIQHELGLQGQALFNTTLSIQNRTNSVDSRSGLLSFDLQKAYDPSEYPVTVNVETTRDREGVLLRYWTDALSEAQAKGLADAIAQVFTSFIEKPSESISELEVHGKTLKVDALRPRKLSQSINGTPLEGLDNHSLTRLIDDRVNEVIRQMLREGQLRLPSQSDKSTAVKEPSCENKYSPVPAERRTDETEKANTPPAPQGREKPDEVESKLWNVWSSSLGLPSSVVKARDSFFKLGGDSITAMKMVSAAREQGLALSVADVFNKPTFKDMLATVRAATVPLPTIPVAQDQKESEKPRENKTILTKSIPLQADSALRFANVDTSSLRNGICPRVGVFKGGIADVLPVTDFQSLSITATLFKSRWMLNYFYLDGKGPLDLRRLRESCMRVVDSFDILRAVFVCLRGQFFQVVLRKVRPSIFVYETEESMDEFTESLRQKDREQEPRQGEQYVKFFIVKKKGSDQHRILIRLSHTQFDGVCVSKIMSALKMAYEGSPLPPVSSFANYMRLLPSTITPENYQHWATLLKGSKMPAIIRREGPNTFQHIGSFTELKKTIQLPSSGLGNITMATVIQAAWSMTLAKLCAQSDVVFGMTINGRNTTIPGVENTVGPCVNTVPVRVKFEEQWTGLDLFRYLQDQQISNMPYESLGFREIIRHCTDWPDSTYFTTSVFHQNVDYEGHLQLDNTWYRIGGAGAIDSLSDLTVVSKQTSTTTLDISLGYSLKSAIHPAFAAKALNMLSETLDCLITNPNTILPSASTLRSLPSQSIPDHPRSSDAHFLSSHLKSRSIAELLVHSDILSKTWLQVLPARDGDKITPSSTSSPITNHSPFQLDSSFFDLGGDIFSMAQLVWLLDQEGLHVRLEDLLDHPTFLGQMAVLALHNQTSGEVDVDDIDAGSAEKHVDNRSQQSMEKSESRTPWGKAVTLARRFTKKSFVLSWA